MFVFFLEIQYKKVILCVQLKCYWTWRQRCPSLFHKVTQGGCFVDLSGLGHIVSDASSMLRNLVAFTLMCMFMHDRTLSDLSSDCIVYVGEGKNRIGSMAVRLHAVSVCVHSADRCEGWLRAQRSVGRTESKLNPAETANSTESAPTSTR